MEYKDKIKSVLTSRGKLVNAATYIIPVLSGQVCEFVDFSKPEYEYCKEYGGIDAIKICHYLNDLEIRFDIVKGTEFDVFVCAFDKEKRKAVLDFLKDRLPITTFFLFSYDAEAKKNRYVTDFGGEFTEQEKKDLGDLFKYLEDKENACIHA